MKTDAFPRAPGQTRGMSQLDYFAGQAMQSLVARVPWMGAEAFHEPKSFAEIAYDIATAMVAEARKRENET